LAGSSTVASTGGVMQEDMRMMHQIGVEGSSRALRIEANSRPAEPGSPAGQLPQRGPGARPARDEHGVQARNVHPSSSCRVAARTRLIVTARRPLRVACAILWKVTDR